MAIRVYFKDKQAGRKFEANMKREGTRVRRAMAEASDDALEEMLDRGRANIASAGRFGRRWTEGLQGTVGQGGGNIRIAVTHAVPYFSVFQEGKVIHGKPLLWIPLSHAQNAQGVRARDYPGRLFRVDRGGGLAPLLLDSTTKEPKYFGKESVTIPKKFKVLEIIRDVSRKIQALYRRRFKELG